MRAPEFAEARAYPNSDAARASDAPFQHATRLSWKLQAGEICMRKRNEAAGPMPSMGKEPGWGCVREYHERRLQT